MVPPELACTKLYREMAANVIFLVFVMFVDFNVWLWGHQMGADTFQANNLMKPYSKLRVYASKMSTIKHQEGKSP